MKIYKLSMRANNCRWGASALIICGIVLIGLGLSSCRRYYQDVRTGTPVEDADGDVRPYVAFKTFFLRACGGAVLIVSGVYLRKAGQHSRNSAAEKRDSGL